MRAAASAFVSPIALEIPNEHSTCPERVLLAAVLWRAYWDLKATTIGKQDRQDAIRWFEGKNELPSYFEYHTIIEILNLSAYQQQVIADAVFEAKHGDRKIDDKPKTKGEKSRAQYSPMAEGFRYRVRP